MGRLQYYCAKLKQSGAKFGSKRHIAQTSSDAIGFSEVQTAAVSRVGSERGSLALNRLQSVAPQEFITRFSSGSQECGLDGPVCGATSKAGGISVVQIQLNQNTEQHRCNAV